MFHFAKRWRNFSYDFLTATPKTTQNLLVSACHRCDNSQIKARIVMSLENCNVLQQLYFKCIKWTRKLSLTKQFYHSTKIRYVVWILELYWTTERTVQNTTDWDRIPTSPTSKLSWVETALLHFIISIKFVFFHNTLRNVSHLIDSNANSTGINGW